MDFTLTLTDSSELLALQAKTDEFNKLRSKASPAIEASEGVEAKAATPNEQVDMQGYLQEVLNGMVYTDAQKYDTTKIDEQIAELQAKKDDVAKKATDLSASINSARVSR